MPTFEFLLGLYIANFVSTYAIKCHVINKNVAEFYDIAKERGIPDGLRDYMIDKLDKKPEWYDYIPVVNLAWAIKDWITRKKDMKSFVCEIDQFEQNYGPVKKYVVDTPDEYIEVQTEYREYYVGYFEEGRPVVIYFYYNGDDDISISDESAKTYEKLDPQTKMDILMHILYQIYIGSKEYIRCPWIDEVFTDIMVDSLVQTFEGNIKFYKLDEEKNKNLVRRKPKDK